MFELDLESREIENRKKTQNKTPTQTQPKPSSQAQPSTQPGPLLLPLSRPARPLLHWPRPSRLSSAQSRVAPACSPRPASASRPARPRSPLRCQAGPTGQDHLLPRVARAQRPPRNHRRSGRGFPSSSAPQSPAPGLYLAPATPLRSHLAAPRTLAPPPSRSARSAAQSPQRRRGHATPLRHPLCQTPQEHRRSAVKLFEPSAPVLGPRISGIVVAPRRR